jgi:hypothetical protein
LFATSLHIRRNATVSALWVWRGASSGNQGIFLSHRMFRRDEIRARI